MADDVKFVKFFKDAATQKQNNTINVDDFYTKAGFHFRRRQKFWWICLSFVPFFTPFQMIQIIFIGLIPEFSCTVGNLTFDECKKDGARFNCSYDSKEYPDSLVRKWSSSPCDTFTPKILQVIFMCGVMCGALSLGAVADRYGRKPVLGGCIFGTIFFAVLCVLVSDYFEIFATFRFFVGIGTAGGMNSAFILAGELVGPKYRGILSTILMAMFAIGIVVCSGLAYAIQKSWVLLSLVLGLIPIVLIPIVFVVPESPHWLLAFKNGDKKKGLAVLEKLAGCKAVDDFLSQDRGEVQEQEQEQTTSIENEKQPAETIIEQDNVKTAVNVAAENETDSRNIGDGIETIQPNNTSIQFEPTTEIRKSKVSFSLQDHDEAEGVVTNAKTSENKVKAKKLPSKGNVEVTASDNVTVIMMFRHKYFLIFIQVVYYALTYAAGSNSLGDVYLMNAFNGLVELPAYLLTAVSIEKCGRRNPLAVFMILAGICLFIVELALPQNLYISLLGKLFISASFSIIFTHTAELFPTTVRNSMLGICTFFARAAGVVASYFVGVRTEGHVYGIVMLGVLSIVSGLLNLLLPETLKKPLPNSLYDMNNNLGLGKCRH